LAQEVEIGDEDTAQSLHDRLAQAGARLIIEALDQLDRGTLRPMPQNHAEASYAPILKKEDGLIDWNQGAREIFNRIRGFNPWPGAFTYLKGMQLKIFRGEIIDEEARDVPGKVIQSGPEGVKVATGKGFLLIREVQLEGRMRMPIREFLTGNQIPPGTQMG
jgi:methionyl-tRNA formyltransferase